MAKLSLEDAARAAVPTGEAPEDLHVTLGYLARPATDYSPDERNAIVSALSAACSGMTPFSADAFATAHFNPNDDERDPAAVVLVQSDELAAAHDKVAAALGDEVSTTFPIYIPHVTLAYGMTPDVIPDGIAGSTLTFDRIVCGWGGDEVGVDSPADTGGDSMTAATEAPVTAPTEAPPAPTEAPEATGGDTGVSDEALEPSGITWSGPLALLDTPSSDGRQMSSTGGRIRPLPQPLKWQESEDEGHDGAVIVGRILAVEARANQLWGSGDWLDPNLNLAVAQAMQQVDAGLGFISVDLAVFEIGYRDGTTGAPVDPVLLDPSDDVIEEAVAWELGGATILSFAAFADARIQNDVPPADTISIVPEPAASPGGPMMTTFAAATPQKSMISDDGTSIILNDGSTAAVGDPVGFPDPDGDGTTQTGSIVAIDASTSSVTIQPDPDPDGSTGDNPPTMTVDVETLVPVPTDADAPVEDAEASLLASSEVRPYRAAFFAKRNLAGPTPLSIDPETGEVFGHLATWGECHLGKLMEGKCVTAPPAPGGDYSYFHLSDVQTDDGLMSVGKITLGAGHASRGGMRYALAHYDNSATAVAVVRAHEDDYGIQVTGQLIHDTPSAKVEELMRSPLSGDWRGVNGDLRLTAALAVNTPGFPVRRPIVGMSGDRQISLVAAGIVELPDDPASTDIVLPSGRTVSRDDFETLTAAAIEVVERRSQEASDDEIALARARLHLVGGKRNRLGRAS